MPETSKKTYNVLVVDDDTEWMNFHLDTISKYFGDENIKLEKAYGAREALLKVLSTKTHFDWIITDMEMENVADESYAGQWLVKNLKKRPECQNTKFLIVSGAPNIINIAIELGVDCIPKYNYHYNQGLLKYKFEEAFPKEDA